MRNTIMSLSIKELKEKAKESCNIDKNHLDRYSLDLAKTTSRWTAYLIDEKLVFEQASMKYHIAKRKKHEYYSADFHLMLNTSKEKELYMDADVDLLKEKEKMIISEAKVELIESTIKILNTSSFNVRNAIEFLKYQQGAY